MRHALTSLSVTGLLLTSSLAQAVEDPLTNIRCFASPATPVTAYAPAKKATAMPVDARYRAPTTSPRLETLDVLSIGLSLDVFRQGQAWQALQQQNIRQPESLHLGSILPMDPEKYPVTAGSKDAASEKREQDALELGLRNFLEKWPIPTVTVVSGWDPKTPNLRFTPERTIESLSAMVDDMRIPAGLHWHRILNFENGTFCSDTPENLVESLFLVFELNPDLPAVLVYVNEGFNMALSLTTKGNKPIGVGTGPRQPGELTDSMVALIVGRPERVEWLRYYAQYTKANKNKIDPAFNGWGWRKPAVEFQSSKYIPMPWTERAFEQWDAQPVLAKLHRPVVMKLQLPDSEERLKREALTAQLAIGWKTTTDRLATQPTRLFYDGGLNSTPLAEIMPALSAAGSSLDLLNSKESYDLTQRLGDTGAASPFVGIALATMASYINGDTSVVMPLRWRERAMMIAVSSATPGKKNSSSLFGTHLMPQNASADAPLPTPPMAEPRPKSAELIAFQKRLAAGGYAVEEFELGMNFKNDFLDDL